MQRKSVKIPRSTKRIYAEALTVVVAWHSISQLMNPRRTDQSHRDLS